MKLYEGEIVNWNHDVAKLPGATYTHIIMRHSRFSLCGRLMRDQPRQYVGAWDSGEKVTCSHCKRIWHRMRDTALAVGVRE
jgi:hypothetical protein